MASREVGDLLEECVRAAQQSRQPTEAERLKCCSCRDSLCPELASLLLEAMEMKWPFVPEKWQYKQTLSASDKTNLSDLIREHLSELLAVLRASITAQEARVALAAAFLVDRFLYWKDESSRLLKITKLLHRRHPNAPIAPQLVIRQARVYLNSGKLQKAEYVLSHLINNSGTTGCWVYCSESDRALVQAVSVQVRGMILQKLGLWLEAAELIWASLVGYHALPQPDKKGIGTSLGILANILVSMNDEDFHIFRSNPDIGVSLLGDTNHRLLLAAHAAKMAMIYSQYTSLYVLTNAASQGTCLLSYSFSKECPAALRQSFLLQAREAFTIGLLTKAEGEVVASKQELHTFLKAAYSLAITHKWLGALTEVVAQAIQACQKALANFYDYDTDIKDKDKLCAEIMQLVGQVKRLLRVEPFHNSDKGSFIPDSYRNIKDTTVNFTLEGFARVMQRFQKYHASLCEETNTRCKRSTDEIDGVRLCITALGTTIGTLSTECQTETCRASRDAPKRQEPKQQCSDLSAVQQPQRPDMCTTVGSTDDLGSSWQNFSLSISGSPIPSSSAYTGSIAIEANAGNQSCMEIKVDDDSSDSKRHVQGCDSDINSHMVSRSEISATSSSNASSDLERFEVIQARVETVDTEEDWVTDVAGVPHKPPGDKGAAETPSQLSLRTSFSSLSDSFSSHSSWEKVDFNPTEVKKNQASCFSKVGTGQSQTSQGFDGSFCILETLDSESTGSALDPAHKSYTSQWECRDLNRPQLLESHHVDPNMDTEVDSVSVLPASKMADVHPNLSQFTPEQLASTEASTESSFEMLRENQRRCSTTENGNAPKRTNPSCYNCIIGSTVAGVVPDRQYCLSQQDYQTLLAGVCHECLLMRFHSDEIRFKLQKYRTAYSALHLKFSKATGLWTAMETCVYIGEPMGMQGKQRTAIWVTFLHQEERLSSYVGKDYLKPKEIQFHLKDVERQMTAQHYVTQFNKKLYDKEVMAQIFFIPSDALLILKGSEIVGCVTVEPYMLGDFVKLTNNTGKKDKSFQATEYGLAFGHFTYLLSDCKEVVVDLQGWVTADGKGLTYLTDPQIHSTRTPRGPSNFAARGLQYFLDEQHGQECNSICQLLKLPPLFRHTRSTSESLSSMS